MAKLVGHSVSRYLYRIWLGILPNSSLTTCILKKILWISDLPYYEFTRREQWLIPNQKLWEYTLLFFFFFFSLFFYKGQANKCMQSTKPRSPKLQFLRKSVFTIPRILEDLATLEYHTCIYTYPFRTFGEANKKSCNSEEDKFIKNNA